MPVRSRLLLSGSDKFVIYTSGYMFIKLTISGLLFFLLPESLQFSFDCGRGNDNPTFHISAYFYFESMGQHCDWNSITLPVEEESPL